MNQTRQLAREGNCSLSAPQVWSSAGSACLLRDDSSPKASATAVQSKGIHPAPVPYRQQLQKPLLAGPPPLLLSPLPPSPLLFPPPGEQSVRVLTEPSGLGAPCCPGLTLPSSTPGLPPRPHHSSRREASRLPPVYALAYDTEEGLRCCERPKVPSGAAGSFKNAGSGTRATASSEGVQGQPGRWAWYLPVALLEKGSVSGHGKGLEAPTHRLENSLEQSWALSSQALPPAQSWCWQQVHQWPRPGRSKLALEAKGKSPALRATHCVYHSALPMQGGHSTDVRAT